MSEPLMLCLAGPDALNCRALGLPRHDLVLLLRSPVRVPRRTAAACGTLSVSEHPCEPHDVLRSGLVGGKLRTVLNGELLEFIVELVADGQRLVDVGAEHHLDRRVAA